MKKYFLFWIGLLCANFIWAGATTDDIINPTFDQTHPAISTCQGTRASAFATNYTGDEYLWYRLDEATGIYKYVISVSGDNKYIPTREGKYLCKVYKNGSTSSTGNLLSAGSFNFQCNDMTRYDGEDGIYIKDGITYRFKRLICNADDSTYPGGFTCIKDKSTNVKPTYFEYVQSDADPHGYDNTNILVCDGMNSSNFKVWEATGLNITQGVTYQFSCNVANIDKAYSSRPNTLPKLSFYIEVNGQKTLLSDFTAPTTLKKWENKHANYVATSTGTCTIYIINQTTEDDGNDFALDDIFFGTTTSTSGTEKLESFELKIDTKPTITMPTAPTPCLNDPISIEPTVSNAGSNPTYAWTGDATGSDLILTTTAPATAGTKTYDLKVTNGTCSSDASITVTTTDCGITLKFYDTKCLDSEFKLTATTQGDSYTWILPDNSTSTEITNTLTTTISRGGDNTAVRTYTCIITNPTGSTTPPPPVAPAITFGNELVANGDFENGIFAGGQYSGFTSDYLLFNVNASLTSKSDYDPTDSRTTPSGNGYVRLSDDAMDHTKPAPNGGQYFLEIDGDFRNNATDPYLSEYETVLKEPLQAGKPYQLSFIAKSTTSTNIANISMLLKQGTDTYPIMDFTQLATGDWKDYVIENWESPISGTASLIIINKTPTHSGNDYIIDNISFKEVLVGGTATQASSSGDVTEIFYITPEDCKVEDSKQVFQPAGKPYEFGGMSITSSGFYEYEEIGEDGTRQVHQLYLVIQPTIEDKVCQNSEYENHGFEIAASETQNTGELIKTITVKSKATGCEHLDSTTTLKLQVYPTYLQKISDNVNKGDIYNKYGFNIDTENLEGGLYTRKLELRTQVCACDSIIQLDLTVLQPVTPMAFFSPNGDNLNELWHVEGLDSYELGYVCIYDRHHRLLATIKGSEYKGWDGNYNGHPMPMDDYWYVITIPENNQQISGHFCLKR